MTETRATLIGFTAVLMWATLALFTAASGAVPPFQLTGLAFIVAFVLACLWWWHRGVTPWRALRLPPSVWVLGVGGLFGYHFFYFLALRNAPPVEASLIAYLWPLLIVVFSALLPGERLRWFHVAGAITGLAGTVVLVTDGGELAFMGAFAPGHAAALVCALVWSGYSVLSRRLAHVSTDAIGGFCGATAVLAWVCHGLFETTVWPVGTGQWLAVLALGLGPVGGAFFVWDVGIKRGNIRTLGASAYLAPLLSALILVAAGFAAASWSLALACALIVGGAALAAKEMLRI